MSKEKLVKKSFDEHYLELKKRLFVAILIFTIFTIGCFLIADELYLILNKPLLEAFGNHINDRRLIFTGLTEGLATQLQLALYFGLLASLPFIVTQFYLFISPGLYRQEKIVLFYYIASSVGLLLFSLLLVYFFVMPTAWKFFLSFENLGTNVGLPIILEPRISEYLDLVLEMIVGFSIAFQLPIALVILIRFGILTTNILISFRRYAIVIVFILAAILTPPDVLSQVILAMPMLLLYETSILIGKLIEKKRKNAEYKIYKR
jgi:sec-independent protein translocase protein TatC